MFITPEWGKMHNEEVDRRVIKDMSEDYIIKLSVVMDEIDYLKKLILSDQEYILNLEERIHALFVLLSRKMSSEELRRQYRMRKIILSIPVVKRSKVMVDGRPTMAYKVNREEFNRYRQLLELREISLHQILEKNGLTATSKKERVKLG